MKKPRTSISTAVLMLACTASLLFACSLARSQEVQSIKPEELKKMIESQAAVLVVDNQPKEAYDMEHIPGAVNFPWAPEVRGPVRLPRDKTLVIYCACSHEEDSTDTATQLMKKFGYKNVKILEGGWLRWQELGYPSEKSSVSR